MIKLTKRLSAALCALLVAVCGCTTFFAESTQKLTDDASLFSDSEAEEITQMLESATENTGWDIIIYTNYNDVDSYDMENYCNSYYDEHGYGIGYDKDGVFLTIDMGSRQLYVITKGEAMYYFSDERTDDILDTVQYDLADGEYYQAAEDFVEYTLDYYNTGKPDEGTYTNVEINEKADHPVVYSLIHYGIPSLIAGIVIAALFVLFVYLRYRNNGKQGTYDLHKNSSTRLTVNTDTFLTKHVSVTKINTSSDSGGGSSGGSSGGGSSHGGGGRGF